ncbi:MAG: ribosome biogenesis protein ytm1 [Chrysothrix sp. TS-e1954]|nr:MAG: ribosome biogenesis protein ytm1 [Chrysothrix sp. TS-e1954]
MATTTLTAPPPASSSINEQVRISLSTRDQSIDLPDPSGSILVSTRTYVHPFPASPPHYAASSPPSKHHTPTNSPTTGFKRRELSSLVNTLLTSATPIPFEFLINGQLLSTPLSSFLTDHGLDSESLLEIEYIRALLPPTPQASFEHDDWVGGADVLSPTSPAAAAPDAAPLQPGHERILSGSFDGSLRVWDTSARVLAVSKGAGASDAHGNRRLGDGAHPQIFAAKWLSPTLVVAGGMSCYLRVMRYAETASTDAATPTASLVPALNLHGHTMPVRALDVHAGSQTLLSGSDDRTACLWSTDPTSPTLPPAPVTTTPASKRLKASPHHPTAGPLTTLTSHTDSITSLTFHPHDRTAAYTSSLDTSLKTWDLTTSRAIHTQTPSMHTPLLALRPLPDLNLLATAAARRILLLDPRIAAGKAVSARCAPSGMFVSGIAATRGERFRFASSSFDGTVRVWDVRNVRGPLSGGENAGGGQGEAEGEAMTGGGAGAGGTIKPLFRVGRQRKTNEGEGKVLGVVWDESLGLVSWGQDRAVQIDKTSKAGG